MMGRSLLAAVLVILPALLGAEPARVGLEVPLSREGAFLQQLSAVGVDAIAWSNAVVEISAFDGLQQSPLAALKDALTPEDPRWDPWLKGLERQFHPQAGVSRVYVEAADLDRAMGMMGSSPAPTPRTVGPRQVTGWLVLFFAVLFGAMRVIAEVLSPSTGRRRWLWAATPAVAAVAGLLLVAASLPGPAASVSPSSAVPFERHRWFQEAWAFGAAWADGEAGKAWSYPDYEKRDGRIVEVQAVLAAPDAAWRSAVWQSLDKHHAARIFGTGNP